MSISTNEIYKDPKDMDEIINRIKNANMHDDVMKIITETFPSWIVGYPTKYSDDYPSFTDNWNFVCKKSGCTPLNIIIVDFMCFNEKGYTLVQMFSELLTMFGHSIRRKEEFIGCKICGNAIPTEQVFYQLRERNVKTPNIWMVKCVNC